MNTSKRVAISSLVFAIVLAAGLLFWPLILNNIIKPTALAVWILLRTLVLGVDQVYFWLAMILLAIILLFRFLPEELIVFQSDDDQDSNATIENIATMGPKDALTGPIARGDIQTVHRHLEAVEDYAELANLYRAAGLWTLRLAEQKGELDETALQQLYDLLTPK